MTDSGKKTLGLLLVGAVLLFALYASLVSLVEVDEYRPRVVALLEEITHRPVTLTRISLSPGAGPTLRLEGLEILSSDPTEPPLLQVDEAYLGIPLSMLWDPDRIRVTSLKLLNPQINLVQRQGTYLLERAQETAEESSQRMLQLLGVGLAELTIGKVSIRDGIITVLNWDHPLGGRTLIIDRLQLQVHELSASKPSPVSASARFQSIPFTANGHLGPLPKSLNLFQMPALLSLEAKSVDMVHLTDTFGNLPVKTQASRSYFSALLHGSLAEGMQVNTWLELDQLQLTPRAHYTTPPPMDLAVRQKGVFHLGRDTATLDVDEMFVYLDDHPTLDVKGSWRIGRQHDLNLEVNTLDPLDLTLVPKPESLPPSGGWLEAHLSITGNWPQQWQVEGQLDLGRTFFSLPGVVEKEEGRPLQLSGRLAVRKGGTEVTLEQAAFTREPGFHLRLAGSLLPQVDLSLEGLWPLPLLDDYFPLTRSWDTEGTVQLRSAHLRLPAAKAGEERGGWQFQGGVEIPMGRIGPLPFTALRTRLTATPERLTLSTLEAGVAQGRISGDLLVDLSGERPFYLGGFMVFGVSLERLPPALINDPLALGGLLSGHGHLAGHLDDNLAPAGDQVVDAHLRVAPGRISGIDATLLARAPTGAVPLGRPGKALYWESLAADLRWQGGTIRFDDLLLRSNGLEVRGEGERQADGDLFMQLTLRSDWWQRDTPLPARLVTIGQGVDLIPGQVEPASAPPSSPAVAAP